MGLHTAASQGGTDSNHYRISEALDFLEKHVVTHMEPTDCNDKMKNLNKQLKQKCRDKNTFFLDPKGHLKGICQSGDKDILNGKDVCTQNLHNLGDVDVIVCKHDKTSKGCTYKSVTGKALSVSVLCGAFHLEEVVWMPDKMPDKRNLHV
uniref:Ribonuclease A-domain domain-containing protein n=1 Tax=Fundulus heteroclitus TaxID=8078 RepID=A0A3Q2PR13_FUNHE